MDPLEDKAKQLALIAFPNDSATSTHLRLVFAEAFKAGYNAGFAEASDREFGEGFREGLM